MSIHGFYKNRKTAQKNKEDDYGARRSLALRHASSQDAIQEQISSLESDGLSAKGTVAELSGKLSNAATRVSRLYQSKETIDQQISSLKRDGLSVKGSIAELSSKMANVVTRMSRMYNSKESLEENLKIASAEISSLRSMIGDLNDSYRRDVGFLASRLNTMQKTLDSHDTTLACFEGAASADMVLTAGDIYIKATDLNTAGAGEIEVECACALADSNGALHVWANMIPTLTPDVGTVTDGTINAPVVVGTPTFAGGNLVIPLTLHTGTGTYIIGEVMDCLVNVNAADTLSGAPVAADTCKINIK